MNVQNSAATRLPLKRQHSAAKLNATQRAASSQAPKGPTQAAQMYAGAGTPAITRHVEAPTTLERRVFSVFKRHDPRVPLLRAFGFQQHRIETSSAGPMYYLERPHKKGEMGPTWVFAHGFAARATDWGLTLAALALMKYSGRIIAVDMPGHGRSHGRLDSRPAHDVLVAGFTEAVDGLLQPDEKALLVGTSMGGLSTVRYAANHPDQVQGLFLQNPAGVALPAANIDTISRFFTPANISGGRLVAERMLGNKYGLLARALAVPVKAALKEPFPERLVQDSPSYSKWLRPDELARAPAHTTIVCGGRDKMFPAVVWDTFTKHLPSTATREIIPHWNHVPMVTHGIELARRLYAWGSEAPGVVMGPQSKL